ncbi:hypothetical protein DRQ53_11150 [bacterium]|nr:MAG: hypothetical protein DRQ53_11150 [bacterium]
MFSPRLKRPALGLVLALAIAGCANENDLTAPQPAGQDQVAPGGLIAVDAPTADAHRFRSRRAKYPLQLGNTWKYVAHVTIEVLGEDDPGLPEEIIRTTKSEITGAANMFGQCYTVEERSITEDISPGEIFKQRVFYRQDHSGLYEATLPVIGPDGMAARAAGPDRIEQQLATLEHGQAWVRTHRALQERIVQMRALRGGAVARFGGNQGGPIGDELTRLDYPLHWGKSWVVVDDAFRMTATVEHLKLLRLPIGRRPAWAVRLESDLFGPEDDVVTYYGREGYLGWQVTVFSDVVNDTGEVIGSLRFVDVEMLQDVEIDRRGELACGN